MDLERLFRQIVVNLAATDPGRLHGPLTLADIRDSIVPYRANRRTLQIESSEDYELALLRLGAGEGGLAQADNAQAQAELAAELSGSNPDLSILQRQEKTAITLDSGAVAKILDVKPELKFAPSQSPIAPGRPAAQKSAKPVPEAKRVEPPMAKCSRCGSTLPVGRVINFCPQCGHNLTRRQCPQCNTEVEATWKHCVSCGAALGRSPH